jgi:hypothetical protein
VALTPSESAQDFERHDGPPDLFVRAQSERFFAFRSNPTVHYPGMEASIGACPILRLRMLFGTLDSVSLFALTAILCDPPIVPRGHRQTNGRVERFYSGGGIRFFYDGRIHLPRSKCSPLSGATGPQLSLLASFLTIAGYYFYSDLLESNAGVPRLRCGLPFKILPVAFGRGELRLPLGTAQSLFEQPGNSVWRAASGIIADGQTTLSYTERRIYFAHRGGFSPCDVLNRQHLRIAIWCLFPLLLPGAATSL